MSESKKSIKEWACDDRPREKMILKGKSALSDAELIAILIGSGSTDKSAVELARHILSDNGNNLAELSKRSIEELIRYHGIGEAKAVSIVAALEIGSRRGLCDTLAKPQITNSLDAYRVMLSHIDDFSEETFLTIYLSQANNIIKVEKNSGISGITQVAVNIREIFKKALNYGATGIIIGHNHPSDRLVPSKEDNNITVQIHSAGKLLNINVLDHIIIGSCNYYSYVESGLLKDLLSSMGK